MRLRAPGYEIKEGRGYVITAWAFLRYDGNLIVVYLTVNNFHVPYCIYCNIVYTATQPEQHGATTVHLPIA